jgi:hypothetical protein
VEAMRAAILQASAPFDLAQWLWTKLSSLPRKLRIVLFLLITLGGVPVGQKHFGNLLSPSTVDPDAGVRSELVRSVLRAIRANAGPGEVGSWRVVTTDDLAVHECPVPPISPSLISPDFPGIRHGIQVPRPVRQ